MHYIHVAPFLQNLITDGIVAGVGSVLVFVPQIIVLFFFISLLEDSGYMARIAVLMDRTMESIGLSGKSFIPMIIDLVVMYLVLWQHGVLKMKKKDSSLF